MILGLVVFAVVMSTGWQLAACELTNYELRDDLKDVAAMGGSRIGLLAQSSDNDLRDAVIRRAAQHDVHLAADQILVERSGTAGESDDLPGGEIPGAGGDAGSLADFSSQGDQPVAAWKPSGEQQRCPDASLRKRVFSKDLHLLDHGQLPSRASHRR